MNHEVAHNDLSVPLIVNPVDPQQPRAIRWTKGLIGILVLVGILFAAVGCGAIYRLFQKYRISHPYVSTEIKYSNDEILLSLSEMIISEDSLAGTAVSPDIKYIAYLHYDGDIEVKDIQTRSEIAEFDDVVDAIKEKLVSFKFSSDGKYLILCTAKDGLKIWNIETKLLTFSHKFDKTIKSIALTNDLKQAVVGLKDDNMVKNKASVLILSIEAQPVVEKILLIDSTDISVALSRDDKYIVTFNFGGDLRVWDFQTQTELKSFDLGLGNRVQISDDSKYIISINLYRAVQVWSLETYTLLATVKNSHNVEFTGLSDDSKYLISASEDQIKVTEVESGQLAGYVNNGDEVSSAAMTKGHRYLITGDEEGNLKIWDLQTMEVVFKKYLDDIAQSIEFSKDQKYLLVICQRSSFLWKTGL